jgi:hypothetical protein
LSVIRKLWNDATTYREDKLSCTIVKRDSFLLLEWIVVNYF